MEKGNRRLSERELQERRRRRNARLRAERRRKRRRRALMLRVACVLAAVLVLSGAVWGISALIRQGIKKNEKEKVLSEQEQQMLLQRETTREQAVALAKILARQYDYDGAVNTLKSIEGSKRDKELTKLMADYEMAKSNVSPVNVERIPHIFFNSLIADKEDLFTTVSEGLAEEANVTRLTVGEFKKVLQQLYERGFVLVRETDIAKIKEDGTMGRGSIYLPGDRQALVLSVNDLSYPFMYMGKGTATRLVEDAEGKVTCEYQRPDGIVETGEYDIIPILDSFIEEHPDFSYKGARGILGFTGYNGILGYRTSPELSKTAIEGNDYADYGTFDYTEEIGKVKNILKILYKEGWEFASNGYGTLSYGDNTDKVKEDAKKWQDNVGSILDEVVNAVNQESGIAQKADKPENTTHIILFPYGTDIGNWQDYSENNEKYTYLRDMGFRYFCNLDSSPYWMQMRTDYLRQGRRAVDGYRLYQELTTDKKRLTDLFDASVVLDTTRPETGLGPMPNTGNAAGSTAGTADKDDASGGNGTADGSDADADKPDGGEN